MATRIERDSLGEVRVPADAYYGAQTQRAIENFPISGLTAPAPLVTATVLDPQLVRRAIAHGLANWVLGYEGTELVLPPRLEENRESPGA